MKMKSNFIACIALIAMTFAAAGKALGASEGASEVIKSAQAQKIQPRLFSEIDGKISDALKASMVTMMIQVKGKYDQSEVERLLGIRVNKSFTSATTPETIAVADLTLLEVLRLSTHASVKFMEPDGIVHANPAFTARN